MDETRKILTGSKELSKVKAPDYKTIYVNSAEGTVSPWDISFTVGHVNVRDSDKLVIEESATLVMSPEHAKAMIAAISSAVEKYESLFGEIKDLMPLLNKAEKAKER